ncbi:MAG TPA: hypothetical protein VI756_08165 [Blastocatellia bacterium]
MTDVPIEPDPQGDEPAVQLSPSARWAIGIYTGQSPFSLKAPPGLINPVLSARNVPDGLGEFVADPFMIRRGDRWFMFFEVLNPQRGLGEIGLAESHDGLNWRFARIVLREPFHLSYPCVFEWDGKYYMTPETLGAGAARLYKASAFPDQWVIATVMTPGQQADPTPFRFDDRWWLFTSSPTSSTLRLFLADDLAGPWREHPASPMIESNRRMARPAGRTVMWDGKLIRFAQDCYPVYGSAVRAFEIVELSTTRYVEREFDCSPVFARANDGWNGFGMHHVDAHLRADGSWIACVDGR